MDEAKQEILIKNNIMVKAKYNLNTVENKVFQLILFNLQKQNKDTMLAEIPKRDFQSILNKDVYKTTKGISNILVKLRKADIWFIKNNKWGNYGFINGFSYDEDTQEFTIKADAEIYKMLFDYLKGYTPVNLAIFFGFKSYYTQRFYELLRLWSNAKTKINYTVDELRDLLMLNEKLKAYSDFKKRIITPAVKELNEKSLMKIDIKEHKMGRKVISIDFMVTDNDKRKYFEDLDNKNDKKEVEYNPAKKLKFKNFDEREYDYNELERKLLGWECD